MHSMSYIVLYTFEIAIGVLEICLRHELDMVVQNFIVDIITFGMSHIRLSALALIGYTHWDSYIHMH